MKCFSSRLVLTGGLLLALTCDTPAAQVFFDNFEGEAIGANPSTPASGVNWFNSGNLLSNTVQGNPLVNGQNGSARALESVRSATPQGYSWIDLSAAQSAQLAAGDLLTIQYQHYWPDASKGGIFLGVYDNGSHGFANNAIDLELRAGTNRSFEYYNSGSGYVSTGLSGSDNWDDVTVVADFVSNNWSLSVNGGTPAVLLFTDNNDMSTVQTIMFAGSSGQNLSYVDNVRVYIGSVPEPMSILLMAIGLGTVLLVRRN